MKYREDSNFAKAQNKEIWKSSAHHLNMYKVCFMHLEILDTKSVIHLVVAGSPTNLCIYHKNVLSGERGEQGCRRFVQEASQTPALWDR